MLKPGDAFERYTIEAVIGQGGMGRVYRAYDPRFLPALGWGIGVAIHALMAFTTNEEDWKEHNQGMQWWLENQREGREGPRQRLAALPEAAKLRVARDTSDDSVDGQDEADDDAIRGEPAVKRRER